MALVETEISQILDEKLNEECNLIRKDLLSQIDVALAEFKERAKWELFETRLDYMSDF